MLTPRGVLCVLAALLPPFSAPGQTTVFPYIERFDSVTAPSLPPGWSASGFTVATTTPRSSPNAVGLSGNFSVKTLLSSPIEFAGKYPDKLVYFERRSATGANFRLEVRAVGNAGFDSLLARFDTIPSANTYAQRVVPLAGFGLEGQPEVRFQWRLLSDSTSSAGVLRIDDVTVTALTGHDLSITGLTVQPNTPGRTDPLELSATVMNTGVLSHSGATLEFYLDANGDGVPSSTELISNHSLPTIPPNESLQVVISHPPMTPGLHRFIARVVSLLDEVPENDLFPVMVDVGFARMDVVVNEIMYAPSGDEPEWVEVYNAYPEPVNLKNWRISDNNTSSRALMSASDVVIPSGTLAIIARDAVFHTVHPGLTVPVMLASFSALNNTTPDAVVLFDHRGATMDSATYQPSWGGQAGRSLERIDHGESSTEHTNWGTSEDSSGRTPGRENSIARLDADVRLARLFSVPTAQGDKVVPEINVIVANDGRYPAEGYRIRLYHDQNRDRIPAANELIADIRPSARLLPRDSAQASWVWTDAPPGESTVLGVVELTGDWRMRNDTASISVKIEYQPGDLVVNEFMYEPWAGQNEWVELWHRGTVPVDLFGWELSDRPTGSGSVVRTPIAASHRVVHPGGFVVVAAESSILSQYAYLLEPVAGREVVIVNRPGGFSLNADGDAVILKDLTGKTIDSVSYVPSWHHPDVIDPRGRSLERIHPAYGSNDRSNWSTAAGILGGSPGNMNSVYTPRPSTTASLTLSPNPFSPDGDGHEDVCIVSFRLPVPSAVVRLLVFDLQGRVIRTLLDAGLTGVQGEVIWDGREESGQRARVGPYVVYLEISDAFSNTIITAKSVAVIATKM